MTDNDIAIKKAIVNIKVFGVGGGGNSVLLRMARDKFLDIDLLAVNTDAKQLESLANKGIKTLQIGKGITDGLGTGGKGELGEKAALADEDKIKEELKGTDLLFVTAGMGGGAGTGATPVVARIAREMGILTVGVVTVPFAFEGRRKQRAAEEGIIKLKANMDALIAVHNDNLMKLPENRRLTLVEAFDMADGILRQAILCIAELVLTTGVINVDFADVSAMFRQSISSDALLGIGESKIDAVAAVKEAVGSPLVERSLKGARGVILNLTGSEKLSLHAVSEAMEYIQEQTGNDVNIIMGTVVDNDFGDNVRVTLIATDFEDGDVMKAPMPKADEQAKKQTAQSLEVPDFMASQTAIPQFPGFGNIGKKEDKKDNK